jgi:hypothetical protein
MIGTSVLELEAAKPRHSDIEHKAAREIRTFTL